MWIHPTKHIQMAVSSNNTSIHSTHFIRLVRCPPCTKLWVSSSLWTGNGKDIPIGLGNLGMSRLISCGKKWWSQGCREIFEEQKEIRLHEFEKYPISIFFKKRNYIKRYRHRSSKTSTSSEENKNNTSKYTCTGQMQDPSLQLPFSNTLTQLWLGYKRCHIQRFSWVYCVVWFIVFKIFLKLIIILKTN